MVSDPLCFLLKNWNKYEAMLRTCITAREDILFVEFERLSRRNSRIRRLPVKQGCRYSGQSCQQRLIALLDDVPFKIDICDTADACMRTVTHHDLLIATCIDWATNIYRDGQARIYIVIRLLRRWAKTDVELDRPILEYLSANVNLPPQQKTNIYRIVAELIHSKHFSVAKYLQWLMARGTLAEHDKPDRVRKFCTRKTYHQLKYIGRTMRCTVTLGAPITWITVSCAELETHTVILNRRFCDE